MLYKTLLKLKEKNGLTDDLKTKIDVFYAVGRITEEQYNELMDVNKEEPKAEFNRLINYRSDHMEIRARPRGFILQIQITTIRNPSLPRINYLCRNNDCEE